MGTRGRTRAWLLLAGLASLLPHAEGHAGEPPRRVLFVNSYHAGYAWSDGIEQAVRETLGAPRDAPPAAHPPELRFFRMDTKRDPSEAHKQAAALEAKALIESWHPDLVITSDDNAAKYLIAPHYRGAELPFVFCGVNWDATPYGLPAANVTGMVEVQLIGPLLDVLRPLARGTRVAFLKGDDLSARREAEHFERTFGLTLDQRFVGTFSRWQAQYLRLQEEADILLLGNPASVQGWDPDTARAVVRDHTRIPSGNWDTWMAPLSLVTFATVPAEQGRWAATTALRVLAGTSPAAIPVVRNEKARILLNMNLARALGVKFPMDLIERATFVEEARP